MAAAAARPADPAPTNGYPFAVGSLSKAQLDEMVAQATVDCCNDDEQATGLFTLIEDNLAVPFPTEVLGVPVTVESVDLTGAGHSSLLRPLGTVPRGRCSAPSAATRSAPSA